MKFTVVGNRIVCSRRDAAVVEFDAHVASVPPHVASKLTPSEIEELQHFMADRQRIQANPAATNVLEALPGLLRHASAKLASVERMNETLYGQLQAASAEMQAALATVECADKDGDSPVRRMRDSEAQKERLDNIRQEL